MRWIVLGAVAGGGALVAAVIAAFKAEAATAPDRIKTPPS
jgi:hypothetical protein